MSDITPELENNTIINTAVNIIFWDYKVNNFKLDREMYFRVSELVINGVVYLSVNFVKQIFVESVGRFVPFFDDIE